jgi:hypothetical protein
VVTGVTGTSREITGTAIGENTMNYYVWIRANNSAGSSAPSAPTSTLDYFLGGSNSTIGIWHTGFYEYEMDYYAITNADIMYEVGYYLPDNIYGFYGFIRAIIPVPNVRDYIERDGPGGVLIFEYDRDYMESSLWMFDSDDDEDDYFSAQYYYAQTGTDDNPESVYMGAVSEYANLASEGDCEVNTLAEALARFTYGNINIYYSLASDSASRYSLYDE